MSTLSILQIDTLIESVHDFPSKGIVFRDITPLLKHSSGISSVIKYFIDYLKINNIKYDCVAGIESRGFMFGTVLASELGVGFIPIRKPGKLPRCTLQESYQLEYGSDCLEVHKDDIGVDDRVILIDDLLATGGTAKAAISLIENLGAEISTIFVLIELLELQGVHKLGNKRNIFSLLKY